MRRKSFSAGVICLCCALFLVGSIPTAPAQTTPAAHAGATELGELLQAGRNLELENRWGEALAHYESALRRFPENGSLVRRLDFSRLHYDVVRRYNDRSFQALLERSSLGDALALYGEVLQKIHTHYVANPNWKQLLEHGMNALEVALSEPAFRQRNLPDADDDAIDAFRHEVRRDLGLRVIRSRSDAGEAVRYAAELARQRLRAEPTAVALEFTSGATTALDPYSTYLTPDQLTDVYAQIEGNFVGLGIEIKADDASLRIVRVIRGSPAAKNGLIDGDRIVAVDGQSTRELSTEQAASLLQGESDSLVHLTVLRQQQPYEVTIRRQRVEVPSVDSVEIIDSHFGVGYLKLTCFQKTTCRYLDAALWKLHREGMRCLMVDLRGNPGGLLVTSVEVVDKFVEKGTIVTTRGRMPQEDLTYSAHAIGTWGVPLVVLIDENSASAAEIFAGAIRDHHRGTIVGTQSFGKGSVQGIFPLDSTSAGVRLTTAKFYSPNGRPYSHVGVEPDVTVQTTARPIDGSVEVPGGEAEDSTLEAGLQVARQLMARR